MYHCKEILCFFVLFAICNASTKNPPLKQIEGPWTIRNASENAIPILGNCPSMNIESSHDESSSAGVIFFKSTIQTFTLTVVNVDSTTYQLFYPNGSDLLGSVNLLHAEKSTFLITELQTEGQIYYAVLTKENQTTPDANKKIDKIWKSSKPAKNVSLAPIAHESCSKSPKEETKGDINGPTNNSITGTTEVEQKGSNEITDVSTSTSDTGKISTLQDAPVGESSTDRQQLNNKEEKSSSEMNSEATVSTPTTKSTSSISTPTSSQTSSDKTITLPIVAGNDTSQKTKSRNSAESYISSSYSSTTAGLLFILIIKTVLI